MACKSPPIYKSFSLIKGKADNRCAEDKGDSCEGYLENVNKRELMYKFPRTVALRCTVLPATVHGSNFKQV